MKEGRGGDHLSVAVKQPGRSKPKPISKEDVYVKPPVNRLSQCHFTTSYSVCSLRYHALLHCTDFQLRFTIRYSDELCYAAVLYYTIYY